MTIDKKLLREAQEAYRQWNEAELRDRLRAVDKRSPQESWQQYVALVEFCRKLAPQSSERQRNQKIVALTQYYDRVQKLEVWRSLHGKDA